MVKISINDNKIYDSSKKYASLGIFDRYERKCKNEGKNKLENYNT